MSHRRSKIGHQKRDARNRVFLYSRYDIYKAETSNTLTPDQINKFLGTKHEEVEVSVGYKYSQGEVMKDARHQGSFELPQFSGR